MQEIDSKGIRQEHSRKRSTKGKRLREKAPSAQKNWSRKMSVKESHTFGSESEDSEEEATWDESNSDSDDQRIGENQNDNKSNRQKKYLDAIKNRLGLTEKDFAMFTKRQEKNSAKVTTVITAAGKPNKEPEVIVFEDPTKKRRKDHFDGRATGSSNGLSDQTDGGERGNHIDMRSAKFDVQQFAVRGMEKADKESAQIAHAIKLGAKPKKQPYMNYKVLMEKRKIERKRDEELDTMEKSMGYKKSSISAKTIVSTKSGNRKRKRGDGTVTKDGQIGRYREGIQFISTKQIDNVKKSRR